MQKADNGYNWIRKLEKYDKHVTYKDLEKLVLQRFVHSKASLRINN